jgi:RES domain-containing protein
MVLWRISRHRELTGTGALRVPGRWHHVGQPIVYLAESPAGALLEVCVHTSANDVPAAFTLLKVQGPDRKISVIHETDLPEDWRLNFEITRDIGSVWLRKMDSALLRVPSAIVPATSNFLLNPAHVDEAKFRIVEFFSYPFDMRIKT